MANYKTLKVAGIEIPNRYFLAPLAGYTDLAFRKICAEHGAGLVYTEMVSANALFYNSKDTLAMVRETQNDEGLVALQLFGGEIDHILKAIEILEDNGKYDFLDINLGCSVPKVLKQHAGCYLIDKTEILEPMLEAIVKKSSKPVIVKTRIGTDDNHINIFDNLKIFEKVGVQMVALHGRTRKALFSGKNNFDIIKEVKAKANIPVVANGDINLDNFQEVLDYTKADAIMLGRNAIGNPNIFTQMCDKELGNEVLSPTFHEQVLDFKKQNEYYISSRGEERFINIIKGYGPHFFRGFSISKAIRSTLVTLKNIDEYYKFIDDLLQLNNQDERRKVN